MNLRVAQKAKTLVMPFDNRIAATVPHAKIVEKNGRKFHLVPHRACEVKLLRNLGYRPPAPVLSQYDWCGTTPFKHQITTVAMLTTCSRAYVLNGLGSGKTRSALFAADFLMKQGEARKALIVAPLSTLSGTWDHEIFKVMPHREARILHGTRTKRLAELAEDADFYIINTDGLSVIEDALMSRGDIDVIIVDELAQFRNARTRRHKLLKRITHKRKWLWGMTGLPTPNGPTDAWGQARIITPERVPKYFKQFQQSVEYQVTQFKWNPRPEANRIVRQALQPAVRFATDDCIDLPPTTYSTRTSNLGTEQAKAYKDLIKQFYTMYQNSEIVASNAGVKMAKLLQVACGFAYTEAGPVSFPTDHKIDVVEEIIDETEQKVLVFVPFTEAVKTVTDRLTKNYSVDMVDGGVSKNKRDVIFSAFRTKDHPRVLVAHPGVLSHGLTLTEASVIIWYSPTMSYETYEQANARIVRPGQKHHTHIVNIESCSTETYMFNRLRNKSKMSIALLDMFAEMTKKGVKTV